MMEDFAGMVGMECLVIYEQTTISQFKKEISWNDVTWSSPKR
ncbi:MAG: hypothetical protein WDM78_04890 [Puia sp.]